MKLYVSPKELKNYGLWEKYCKISNSNIGILKEDSILYDEDFVVIDEEMMHKLGLKIFIED